MPWRVVHDRVQVLLSVETRSLQQWEIASSLGPTVLWLLGGRRDWGETAEACAGREFGEECGGVFGTGHASLGRCLSTSVDTGDGFGSWMSFSKFVLFVVPIADLPPPSRDGPVNLLGIRRPTPSFGGAAPVSAPAEDRAVASLAASGAGGDEGEVEDIVDAHAAADRSVMRSLGPCFLETYKIRWVDLVQLLESIPASDGHVTSTMPGCVGDIELPTASGDAFRVGHFVIMVFLDKLVRKQFVAAVSSAAVLSGTAQAELEAAAAIHQRYKPRPFARPGQGKHHRERGQRPRRGGGGGGRRDRRGDHHERSGDRHEGSDDAAAKSGWAKGGEAAHD